MQYCADVALAANQTEERLLTAIRDPVIVDRTGMLHINEVFESSDGNMKNKTTV